MAPRKASGKGKQALPPQGPRVRGSSSQGGIERENEEVDDRFVSLDAQTLYQKVLINEVLIPSMRFDWSELDHSEFAEVFADIEDKGLKGFLGFNAEIFEDAVKEFYANLSVVGSNVENGVSLKSKVGGRYITLCESNLSTLFHLPRGGVRPRTSFIDFEILRTEDGDTDEEADRNFGYTEEKGADLLCQLCSPHTPPFEAMDLPLKYRLLHYALNRVIYPKKASNNQITSLDKEILWHLEEGRSINYPSLIIQLMRKKASLFRGELKGRLVRHKGMPYAALITALAEFQRCDLSEYASSPYPSSWRFTPYNLRSMRLVRTVEQGWVYIDHVATLGLTVEEVQEPTRPRPKRASSRPSSSRPRAARRSDDVSQVTIQDLYEHVDDLHDRMDDMQNVMKVYVKKVNATQKMIKKIFDKLGCRHDDTSD